jgi:TRAP transporter TAXI family solute receptor
LLTIDKGKYRGVNKPVQTVAVKAALIVSDDLREDLVYNITKGLFEFQGDIAAAHPMGEYLDVDDAIKGITVPFHPGAIRYYREVGGF